MIHLPIDRLPPNPGERRRRLEAYFGDLIPTSETTEGGWSVRLDRARFKEFYVDPALRRGLDWWGPEALVEDIHRLVRRDSGFQLSLDDSWTLYDWSIWLSESVGRGVVAKKEVVILHVDDHTDFMTPRVAQDGGVWSDLITGQPCDLAAPETVRSSILSGAVGIGSFMAPFLHGVARCDFRHLSQSVSRRVPEPARRIGLSSEPDTLLKPGARRPAVVLLPWDAPEGPASHRYLVTSRVDEWIEGLPDAPVLLHIDMDYFNNRFDRDSDWHGSAAPRHDPGLAAMEGAMDELFAALGDSGVAARIESVAVALSPGFFPAEFWQPLTERLAERLREVARAGPHRQRRRTT